MTGYERAMRGALIGKADGRAANARGPARTRPHDRIPGTGTAVPRGREVWREAQGAGRVRARGNGSVTYGR